MTDAVSQRTSGLGETFTSYKNYAAEKYANSGETASNLGATMADYSSYA